MGTLVCFHAHPDDECMMTGGSMARAAAEGHRVVLVVATNGDHGEVPDDLAPGETLVQRRKEETARSAEVLGVHRVVWLDYADTRPSVKLAAAAPFGRNGGLIIELDNLLKNEAP